MLRARTGAALHPLLRRSVRASPSLLASGPLFSKTRSLNAPSAFLSTRQPLADGASEAVDVTDEIFRAAAARGRRGGNEPAVRRRGPASPETTPSMPAGYLGKHTGASVPGLGHKLTESDRSIAKDLRRATSAIEVLRHYSENADAYDAVALSTALFRVVSLTEGVKPWKRRPLPREQLNALINHSISSLSDATLAFEAGTLAMKEAAAAASGGSSSSKDSNVSQRKTSSAKPVPSVLPRTLVSLAVTLTKLDRAPPVVLNELSHALIDRIEAQQQLQERLGAGAAPPPPLLTAADVVCLTYAFSRANVPAPRLFNRLAPSIVARIKGEIQLPDQLQKPAGLPADSYKKLDDDMDDDLELDEAAAEARRTSRPLKAVRDARKEAIRPFAPHELASLLLSYTSLRTAAPAVVVAAADDVTARMQREVKRRDDRDSGAASTKWRKMEDDKDTEDAGRNGLTSHVTANLATAFARSLGQQLPASAAAVKELSPPAPANSASANNSDSSVDVTSAAMSALMSLAPRVTALASSAKVPVVQKDAFSAQGLAATAWAYARAFTGPARSAGQGGYGGSWGSEVMGSGHAKAAVKEVCARIVAQGADDATLASLLSSASSASVADGPSAWSSLLSSSCLIPGQHLHRLNTEAAVPSTFGGPRSRAQEAVRLAGLRMDDVTITHLLTVLGRAAAHHQTSRTLGPGHIASMARAWADVRGELQRRAANTQAFADAAAAEAEGAGRNTDPLSSARRLLAAAAAAESSRVSSLLTSFDASSVQPVMASLVKQALWLMDPAASGREAAEGAARAKERLGLVSSAGTGKAGSVVPGAGDASASSVVVRVNGKRPSRYATVVAQAKADRRAALAQAAEDHAQDEEDAAALAGQIEGDDGAAEVEGDDIVEVNNGASALSQSRSKFNPLEAESNLALSTTFSLHDATELLHAIALAYPSQPTSSSSSAASSPSALPPTSHPVIRELFVKMARWIGTTEAQVEEEVRRLQEGGKSGSNSSSSGINSSGSSNMDLWRRSLRDLSGPQAVKLCEAFAYAGPPREAAAVLTSVAAALVREHELFDAGKGAVIELNGEVGGEEEGDYSQGEWGLPQGDKRAQRSDVTPSWDDEPTFAHATQTSGVPKAGGHLVYRARGTGGGAGSVAALGTTPLLVARTGASGLSPVAVPVSDAVPSGSRLRGLTGSRTRLHTTRGSWAGRVLGHTSAEGLLRLANCYAVALPANGANSASQLSMALASLPVELRLPAGAYHALQVAVDSGIVPSSNTRLLVGLPLTQPLPSSVTSLLRLASAHLSSRPHELTSPLLATTVALAAGRGGSALLVNPSSSPADVAAPAGPPPVIRLLTLAASRLRSDFEITTNRITASSVLKERIDVYCRMISAVGAAVLAPLPCAVPAGRAPSDEVVSSLRASDRFHRNLHETLLIVLRRVQSRLQGSTAVSSYDSALSGCLLPIAAALSAGHKIEQLPPRRQQQVQLLPPYAQLPLVAAEFVAAATGTVFVTSTSKGAIVSSTPVMGSNIAVASTAAPIARYRSAGRRMSAGSV